MASTYTQSQGTKDHKYFMNVEISPVTVKDGTLVATFDPITHPRKGVIGDAKVGKS